MKIKFKLVEGSTISISKFYNDSSNSKQTTYCGRTLSDLKHILMIHGIEASTTTAKDHNDNTVSLAPANGTHLHLLYESEKWNWEIVFNDSFLTKYLKDDAKDDAGNKIIIEPINNAFVGSSAVPDTLHYIDFTGSVQGKTLYTYAKNFVLNNTSKNLQEGVVDFIEKYNDEIILNTAYTNWSSNSKYFFPKLYSVTTALIPTQKPTLLKNDKDFEKFENILIQRNSRDLDHEDDENSLYIVGKENVTNNQNFYNELKNSIIDFISNGPKKGISEYDGDKNNVNKNCGRISVNSSTDKKGTRITYGVMGSGVLITSYSHPSRLEKFIHCFLPRSYEFEIRAHLIPANSTEISSKHKMSTETKKLVLNFNPEDVKEIYFSSNYFSSKIKDKNTALLDFLQWKTLNTDLKDIPIKLLLTSGTKVLSPKVIKSVLKDNSEVLDGHEDKGIYRQGSINAASSYKVNNLNPKEVGLKDLEHGDELLNKTKNKYLITFNSGSDQEKIECANYIIKKYL